MHIFRRLLLGLLLLACGSAQAQVDTGSAEELMRQSGLWEQIEAISRTLPASVMAEINPSSRTLSATEQARLQKKVAQAFAPERLLATAVQVVSQGMQDRYTRPVLDWYATGTGRAIRQAEIAAAVEQATMKPEDQARLGDALMARTTPARRQLLDALIKTTRSTEAMLNLTQNSMLAMQRGLALAAPDRPWPGENAVRQEMQAQRPALLAAFNEMARASMAMTYHDLPDRALREYLAYCRSPHGRQFNDLGMQAMDQAVSGALEAMMQSLPGTADQQNI